MYTRRSSILLSTFPDGANILKRIIMRISKSAILNLHLNISTKNYVTTDNIILRIVRLLSLSCILIMFMFCSVLCCIQIIMIIFYSINFSFLCVVLCCVVLCCVMSCTGSAGTAVVTPNEALLFADGRYHNQAEMELGSSWTLMRQGEREG